MASAAQARNGSGLLVMFQRNRRTFIGWGILFAVALIFPLVISQTGQLQVITGDVVEGEIYAMLALGLNVVVGFAGLLDLGYAAFFAIGAYSFGMLSSSHFTPISTFNSPFISWGPSGVHANFWWFLPVCALIAAGFGAILGAPTLRLRGDYLAIVTLGFGEIVHKVVTNLGPGATLTAFGWPDITGGTNSLDGIFAPSIAGLQFGQSDQVPWYYLGLAMLAMIIMIAYSLQSSRLGRAWVAMREDELAASCMGINIMRTKLMAFVMGAFFSGFAGVMQGSRLGLVDPTQFTFLISISILVMVVLGGQGSVPGVVLGAAIIAFLQYYLLPNLNNWASDVGTHVSILSFLQNVDFVESQYLIFGIMLVLMMIFRRDGLIPSATRRREMTPGEESVLAEENIQLYDVRGGGTA
jgi:branched-chain amino acid transport system permease protein